MTRPVATTTFAFFSALAILAQPTAFEVSTIKSSSPTANGMSFGFRRPRRFTANNHTLKECVAFAYNVSTKLISCGPSESPDDIAQGEEDLVRGHPRILYASHFEACGADLFRLVCEQDLEGIVCKHRSAPYASESVPWVKVLNPAYSQREGRRENVREEAGRGRQLGEVALFDQVRAVRLDLQTKNTRLNQTASRS